ncbi:MAG: NADH-quinone oxidoreductase subunit J [Campylobacterales bacterium]|nr:NADH-quinone oxidoreductase subunit J [Campylobacterales bacterium]
MFEQIAFYFFSVLTIGLFLIAVFSKNVLYAMTALAMGMVVIAGFFFLVGADFLGVVQLIVYVGAVMALYAFGMMFFNVTKDLKEKTTLTSWVLIVGVTVVLLTTLMFLGAINPEAIYASLPMSEKMTNPEAVGMALFTKYLVPFEVAAVMLLIAMIGGIILAGKKMDTSLTKIEDEVLQEKDVK